LHPVKMRASAVAMHINFFIVVLLFFCKP